MKKQITFYIGKRKEHMSSKCRFLFLVVLLSLLRLITPGASHADSIQDSINAADAPVATGTWTATGVGWLYTPSSSYDLTQILTEFASGSQAVTEAIYSGLPASGGTLLASATFGSLPDAPSGALFPAVSLTAGDTYFIAFEGVEGLGANFTDAPGAESLGTLYSDFGGDTFSNTESGAISTQPILEFVGTSPVVTPEPSSLLLSSFGVLGLSILAFAFRRKHATAALPSPGAA